MQRHSRRSCGDDLEYPGGATTQHRRKGNDKMAIPIRHRRKAGHPARSLHRTPSYRAHVRAHEAVIRNEAWYGDTHSSGMGKAFSAKETAKRQTLVIKIIRRAAKRAAKAEDEELAEHYHLLADKLEGCRAKRRCGSLGCVECARAYQIAKASAGQKLIHDLEDSHQEKHLVFVGLIPKGMMFKPGDFHQIDIRNANRWLKDALRLIGTNRVILGSVDFSWETKRRGGKYLQLHWHLLWWTSNPVQLKEKLQPIFKRMRKYERPVKVKIANDSKFLPYLHKGMKLPNLLRGMRTHIPELLLFLDQTDPIDLMVLNRVRLSAQVGGLKLEKIGKYSRKRLRNEKASKLGVLSL